MTDDVTGGGLTPVANPPAGGGSGSGSDAKGSTTVTYKGHDTRRYGSLELEVGEKTWTFPRGREVEGVPQEVVDALNELEGHDFDISKGA